MIWLVYGFGALLCLKVLWNLSVPYELHRRALGTAPISPKAGISMMPGVEVVLLAAVVASAAIDGDDGRYRPWVLGVFGALAVAGSYLHLLLASILLGWIRSRRSSGEA